MTDHETREDGRTIHERMVAILGALPAIGKDSRNEQQNFMYRSHDDVLNALNPLLAEHGVFMVPRVLERTEGQRQTRSGGVMYEVNLHVQFTFYGRGGDSVTASAWGEGTDSGDKSTNKAMTMAFKNVIAQAFAVSTHEGQQMDVDRGAPEETTGRQGARSRGRTGGRQGRQDPAPDSAEFDPGKHTAPDAPKGPDYWKLVGEMEQAADPSLDWAELKRQILRLRFHVETLAELEQEQRVEFVRRYANACAAWMETLEGGDFPPIDDETLLSVFAWAFPGTVIKIPKAEAPLAGDQPEPSEDVPLEPAEDGPQDAGGAAVADDAPEEPSEAEEAGGGAYGRD